MRRAGHLTAGAAAALVSAHLTLAEAPDSRLPAYVSRPVAFPQAAGYVKAGRAIAIVGYNDMQDMLEAIDALFVAAHPDFRFSLDLRGTRTAPPALAAGTSAFAPMGAEFSAGELRAYRQAVGADPLAIRVAHAAVSPRAKSGPLVIVVHRSNPLRQLTVGEAARIFGTERGGDDLTRWGQLGLGPAWAERDIHTDGLGADTALGEFMLAREMPGRRFRPDFKGMAQSEEVVRRVASDPDAIGFARANVVTPAVRVVALAATPAGPYSAGSAEDVVAGLYPYDRFLYLVIRPVPTGGTLDPWLAEYLRLVLSREGQRAITATPQGYLPLNAGEVAAERARLAL